MLIEWQSHVRFAHRTSWWDLIVLLLSLSRLGTSRLSLENKRQGIINLLGYSSFSSWRRVRSLENIIRLKQANYVSDGVEPVLSNILFWWTCPRLTGGAVIRYTYYTRFRSQIHNIHQSNELFERSLSWNHFNVWRTPESDCRYGHTRRLKSARLSSIIYLDRKTQNCFSTYINGCFWQNFRGSDENNFSVYILRRKRETLLTSNTVWV